ncbi:hypothetical protein JHK86_024480 [Glycine max]|nr:hypothetical protein JHK86_024480 [Glycine max]
MGSEGVPLIVVEVMSVAVVELTDASSWWHEIDDSPTWQDRISYTLVVLYDIMATVALIVQHILLDMSSLAFFTTYALLVLF